MAYSSLILVLPCHCWEDFPVDHTGETAADLLAGWTSLWHPTLIAQANSIPNWVRFDESNALIDSGLVVIPRICRTELPDDYDDRVKSAGARLVDSNHERGPLVAKLLEGVEAATVNPDLVQDFYALGYCFLQIEVLTRQMRYSSSLDESQFKQKTVQAAKSAVEGNCEAARTAIKSCFDLLSEQRDHYYPVEIFLIDLILMAPTTLGESLAQTLGSTEPINILLPASLLETLHTKQPGNLALLKQAIGDGRVGLVGGEFSEEPLPLLSVESMLAQLDAGLQTFDRSVGARPRVFGRRRFGLNPMLPQILKKFDFVGVLHATLDEGRFPESSQSRANWEGADGTTMDSLCQIPLDAARPETFSNLSTQLSESMDTDHVATRVFARWPGPISPWYEDLKRAARYTSSLGKFVTVDEYFSAASYAHTSDRFEVDQYRSPFLLQSARGENPNLISQSVAYWKTQIQFECCSAVNTALAGLTGAIPPARQTPARMKHPSPDRETDKKNDYLAKNLSNLASHLTSNTELKAGHFLFNPLSFSRRFGVTMDNNPTGSSAISLVGKTIHIGGHHTYDAIVDLPPMASAWWTDSTKRLHSATQTTTVAEDHRLRNEYMEVSIDPKTGGILSIRDYKHRGNRLSQRLIMMSKSFDEEPALSCQMQANEVAITANGPIRGQITSRGNLVGPNGQCLASFQQVCELWRQDRVLRLHITLNPTMNLSGNPWVEYFASRVAWADEMAVLWQSANMTRQQTRANRIESPMYVDIESNNKTSIIAGGLPYHRRVGYRMLDTLLIVPGESARTFQLGVAVDVPQSLRAAYHFLVDPCTLHTECPVPSEGQPKWLYHIDARNIVVTHWTSIDDDQQCVGIRLRMLETEGRSARVKLRAFRPLTSGKKLNFLDGQMATCFVESQALQVDMAPHEWSTIEARWIDTDDHLKK